MTLHQMPFFSVVIPVYNREHLIAETLETVFAQQFKDYEVIVVDDGSTDNTHKLLKGYSERIILVQQPNLGAGAARNLGIRYANGEYIAFLDSDDLWFPWTLNAYKEAIDHHSKPSFIAGRPLHFKSVDECKIVSQSSRKCTYYRDYLSSADDAIWVLTSSAVVKRDVLLCVNGFYERKINAEDLDLWLRIGKFPGFVYIVQPIVSAYRRHDSSAVSQDEDTFNGIEYLIIQEINGRYPGGRARKQERLRTLTTHIRPVVLAFIRKRKFKKAILLYAKSFVWHLSLRRFRFLFFCPFNFMYWLLRNK